MDRDNNVEKTKDKINVKNSLKIKASLLNIPLIPLPMMIYLKNL